MRLSGQCCALEIVWTVVASTSLLAQPPDATGKEPARLVLSADAPNQLVEGLFQSTNGEFRFSSRKVSSRRTHFRLAFKGVEFEAEADLDTQTRTIDGKNQALTVEDRASLREFASELERELRPHSRTLDSHLDLAYRAIAYWADAPVGWPLRRRVISQPGVQTVSALEGGVAGSTLECPGGEAFVECLPDCDVEAGTYISYIADGCKLGLQNLWHDAVDDDGFCVHSYCREQVQSGCNQNCGCLGRCTSGCGDDGLGAGTYTVDCAAHDRCCRLHGDCTDPFASECGDEFEDAADDVLFGWTNCPEACAATCPCDACWSDTEYENICPDYWCGDGKCDCACQFEDADCGGPPCAPRCGNGVCDAAENACNCPEDNCAPVCGDGCCNGGEDRCTCLSDGCAKECGASGTQLYSQEDYDQDTLSDDLENELLARHAPILKFEHERLRPTPVWWYLDRVTFLRRCDIDDPEIFGDCTYYAMVPWGALNQSLASILVAPRPSPFEFVSPNIGEGPSWGEIMDYVASGAAPGLYGRVTPHREFIVIQYFQFFAFNDTGWPFDGGDHEGDWMYLDVYLSKDSLDPQMVVWHHHGDGNIPPSIWVACETVESGNRLIAQMSCPAAGDDCMHQSTYYYKCGTWGNFGCEVDEVWANVTYSGGSRIPFDHPVVYLEWGSHEFWPAAGGANDPFETLLGTASIEDHYGNDPHNYGPPILVSNLGEIGYPFPSRSDENAAIMHYNGKWGDWAGEGFFGLGAGSVPYGPAGGQWIKTIRQNLHPTEVELVVVGLPQSEAVPIKFVFPQRVRAGLSRPTRCSFVGNGRWNASILEEVEIGFETETDPSCSGNDIETLPPPEFFYLRPCIKTYEKGFVHRS